MLKRKLLGKLTSNPSPTTSGNISSEHNNNTIKINENSNQKFSPFFLPPFWEQFYAMECQLNVALSQLTPPPQITHIYNPVEYAAQIHCEYLKRFLCGPKKLLFIGMNPGADGMAQNGVSTMFLFSNICVVLTEGKAKWVEISVNSVIIQKDSCFIFA